VHFLPGVQSPLRKADDTELDRVVVRENSEGEYAGLGGRNLGGRGPGGEVAVQSALFTEVTPTQLTPRSPLSSRRCEQSLSTDTPHAFPRIGRARFACSLHIRRKNRWTGNELPDRTPGETELSARLDSGQTKEIDCVFLNYPGTRSFGG
jgi:hypothetical protein